MSHTQSSAGTQAPTRRSVVDWNAKPEPWRSIGLSFLASIGVDNREPITGPTSGPPRLRLRALREAQGLTRAQLADKAGVWERNLANFELGRTKNPYAKTKRDLAAALGVAVEDIWP